MATDLKYKRYRFGNFSSIHTNPIGLYLADKYVRSCLHNKLHLPTFITHI